MLRVDLRALARGPVDTTGQLGPEDPVFEGLELPLDGPVQVTGRIQETGDGDYFWRGRLTARLRTECRRCLTDVTLPIDVELNVLFSDDADAADDPGVYPLPATTTHVDLGEAVREELALAIPSYVLCRDDCAGLCPRCGADLNAGPCQCLAPAEPVRGNHGSP